MKTRWMLVVALGALPVAASASDMAGASLAATCANCHGTDGHSVGGMEPLAGMSKADIVRKVGEFKRGAKPATIMHQISKGYTDAQIDMIAEYLAAQPAKK